MKSIKRNLAVLLAVLLVLPTLTAAAQTDPDVTGGQRTVETTTQEVSSTENPSKGGSSEGDSVQGGSAEGGSTQGGSIEGGSAEGGSTQGDSTGGGSTEGGSTEGGSIEGGSVESGSTQGDSTEDGSTEGGSTEGGSTEDGSTEGGSTEDGSTEGSSTEGSSTENGSTEGGSTQEGLLEGDSALTGSEEKETEEETEEEETEEETKKKEDRTEPSEEVLFNTGSCAFSVVGREDFFDYELGDACFEEDGSYTINIPEENPFFPYEVQFTYDGSTTNQWFMTPDDSVEVGGHRFYVSAYFDGTAVTQLSLKVGGDTIVVYPERKEFTDGDNAMPLSLQPLEERTLATVDLTSYTPAELTMVSPRALFGEGGVTDSDKLVWKTRYDGGDDYRISPSNGILDLSRSTYNGGESWEIIVGDGDQLTSGNIRYFVRIKTAESERWLIPTVAIQNEEGKRDSVSVAEYEYYDYNQSDRRLSITVPSDQFGDLRQAYVGLQINSSVFGSTGYDHFKVYEGNFASAGEAVAGKEITDQICCADLSAEGTGYEVSTYGYQWITMVTFNASDEVTGCLPFTLYLSPQGNYISASRLYEKTEQNTSDVVTSTSTTFRDGCYYVTNTLYKGYAADKEYDLVLYYYKTGSSSPSDVTGAYVGNYATLAEAREAGAEDIKDALFKSIYDNGGYAANYSQGVTFSIFVGEDGSSGQEIYHYCIKAVEGESTKSSNTGLEFYGLNDKDGNEISCYVVNSREDSYAEYSYLTILVDETTDLTSLAPKFYAPSEGRVYASGNTSQEEISGKSIHDFSQGPVEYTVGAENESDARNYWLQVVKPREGTFLYINSLKDGEADTQEKDGAVCSTREVLLDNYHNNRHDILLINMGTQAISNLAVELESDSVELDSYWTLSGNSALSGFDGVDRKQSSGELPNLAKVRIRAKSGAENGTDVVGKLTIKSGGSTLMVLNLTGTIGSPCIITQDIPQAVKYVPYGVMIQNNNKYRRNTVRYSQTNGTLPAGMEVKPNGELYGVPTEAGEFTFTVRMDNSLSNFSSSSKTYTLVVVENTDANVDAATDAGYDLSQRIQNLEPNASGDQLLVSEGIHDLFVDLYLDGVKLVRGTDYTSESGSTRITIRSQTLVSRGAGTHTLGIEFREDTETLKRAAQNYTVSEKDNTGNEDGSENGTNSGGGDGGGSGSGSSDTGNTGSSYQANPESKNGNTGKGNTENADAPVPTDANGAPAGTEGTTITHIVEEGESLWKIAEKYYGSGALWERIYRDNADRISDPNKIYAGQSLTVNITPQDAAATAGNAENAGSGADENAVYYTVKEGDTLWIIARKFYGRGWQWRKIYRANDSITDPGKISVGQVILIPDV